MGGLNLTLIFKGQHCVHQRIWGVQVSCWMEACFCCSAVVICLCGREGLGGLRVIEGSPARPSSAVRLTASVSLLQRSTCLAVCTWSLSLPGSLLLVTRTAWQCALGHSQCLAVCSWSVAVFGSVLLVTRTACATLRATNGAAARASYSPETHVAAATAAAVAAAGMCWSTW